MPAVDMSLDKLREYKGINPKPADFDEFWARALAELNSLSLEYTLEPSGFTAPGLLCDYLYFTGAGGARVCCKFVRPENPKPNTFGVAWFHGYSGRSPDWYELLTYAYAGGAVLALDTRGQSGRSEDNTHTYGDTFKGQIVRGLWDVVELGASPDILYYRNVYLDTAQTARILMSLPFVDENKICAKGGSQGGGLTIACASLEPRVAKMAPRCPFLSDYKRVWDMDLDKGAYDELRRYFRTQDPLHEKEDKIFETLGYIDVSKLAPRIKAECHMYITLLDTTCPPSTQYAIFNNITSKKKELLYYDYGHEDLPYGNNHEFEFFTQW